MSPRHCDVDEYVRPVRTEVDYLVRQPRRRNPAGVDLQVSGLHQGIEPASQRLSIRSLTSQSLMKPNNAPSSTRRDRVVGSAQIGRRMARDLCV